MVIGLTQRRLSVQIVRDSLSEAAIMTAALFSIIIAGMLFSRFLISTGMVREFSAFVVGLGLNQGEFILLIVAIYILLGLFIDGVSVMVITLPLLFPVAKSMGIDGIWLGVIIVKLIEIAAITPPVGINLFAVLGAAKGRVKSGELFYGVLPFVILEIATLALLVKFPIISTWLPSAMFGR